MTEPYVIRFLFTKTGSLQFISHLDLQRTMKSALIRAKIPLWYTEGFNPHPKMIFALPLSIGTESVCELLDIKVNEEVDCEKLREALDLQTTDEMKILKCYRPQEKFSFIDSADYTITFDKDISEYSDIFSGSYTVMKRSKSGEKETDIVPFIRKIEFNKNTVRAVLSANENEYLNPDYVSAAIAEVSGGKVVKTVRNAILKSDQSEFI